MAGPGPTRVILTSAHRDAIFDEIEFAFQCAGDLAFLLEHGDENALDRDDARELISRLHVAVRLLDQFGWQRNGDQDGYLVEVDEAVDRFAAQMERYALAGLEYNRHRSLAGEDQAPRTTRRLINAELEKLSAARLLRTAFQVTRSLKHRPATAG